jgi:WD40 repeat protein
VQAGVAGAAVTPDGLRAVTVSGDKTGRVWELSTGKTLFELCGHGNWVNAVAVYDDGRKAITASVDRSARLWDLRNGHCFATLQVRADAVISDACSICCVGQYFAKLI